MLDTINIILSKLTLNQRKKHHIDANINKTPKFENSSICTVELAWFLVVGTEN